jgi:hypothetical protein
MDSTRHITAVSIELYYYYYYYYYYKLAELYCIHSYYCWYFSDN